MNKLLKSAIVLTGVVALAGCSDVAKTENTSVRSSADLIVSVKDLAYGNAIDSVSVTLLNVNKKNKTVVSTNGKAVFKDIPVGGYQIQLERDGYASMVCYTGIGLAAAEDTPIAANTTEIVEMPKSGATLSGTAFIDSLGSKIAASGAVISASLSLSSGCDFLTSTVSATTDKNGVYTFENLPEKVSVTVSGKAFEKNSSVYTSNSQNATLEEAGTPNTALFTTYSIATTFNHIVASEIEPDAPIVVIFNNSVDVSRSSQITVDDQLITTKWSNSNKTLTITPAVGSSWGEPGDNLSLDFTVFASGASSDYTRSETIKITNTAAEVNLSWDATKNAEKYEVYRKKSTEDNFIMIDDFTATSTANKETYTDNFPGFSATNSENKYFIIAVNSVSRSSYDSKKVATVKYVTP